MTVRKEVFLNVIIMTFLWDRPCCWLVTLSLYIESMSDQCCINLLTGVVYTVKSRYLELGYLEFCEDRNVHLNKKYILIAFSNHNLALETFLQVQITRSAN